MTWCDVVCQDTGSTKHGAAASSTGPEEETLGLGLETGRGRMMCVLKGACIPSRGKSCEKPT